MSLKCVVVGGYFVLCWVNGRYTSNCWPGYIALTMAFWVVWFGVL